MGQGLSDRNHIIGVMMVLLSVGAAPTTMTTFPRNQEKSLQR
jgi:hypothetical protein